MKNFQPVAFVLLIFLLLQFQNTQAQVTADLFGIITDKVGQPIFGASVYLEGTDKGAQTDFDGKYQIIGISPGTYNLVVSYIGYETQTQYNVIIRSKGTPNYNFVLQESAQQLDEVVVTEDVERMDVRKPQMSVNALAVQTIKKIPG